MYRCLECGYEFDTPMVKTELLVDGPPFTVDVCPHCGSDDILMGVDELFDELEADG
jgi:DNA-directed RNA polymerase subunit RPC12/RpoP